MKLIHKLIFLIALCSISGVVAQAAAPAGCPTLTAGYQVLSLPNQPGGSNSPAALPLAIWYPSTAAPAAYAYGSQISGQVALNGAITNCGGGRYPLLVFSHGYSGCGTQSVFLTEELARQGYIVAAPDHQDHGCSINNTKSNLGIQDFNPAQFLNPTTWTADTGSYRNVDIETVVNWLLAPANGWANSIDPSRIAMSGHSFGGYTTFAKIGGWSSWYDARFRTALLLSPYIQPFMYQQAMQVPTVAQFYYGGLCDSGITPWIKGGALATNSGPGAFQQAQFPASGGAKYFAELDDPNHVRDTCLQNGPSNVASHFAFSNDVCFTYQSPTTVQDCLNNVPNAAYVTHYSEAFLDSSLAYGAGPYASLLPSAGSGLNTYWTTAAIPGGTYLPGSPVAPNSIAAIKGTSLAPTTNIVQNGTLAMPLSLSNIKVLVNGQQAALYAISPGQINFVVPDGLSSGCCLTVQVMDAGNNQIASGPISLNAVSPGLFPAIANLTWASGWTDPSGRPIYNPISGSPIPIDVSQGNVYIETGATGTRNASGLLQATVGGVVVPVKTFSSPQYQAIDQIQIGPLPASLAGKGQVNVVLSAGGMQSNAVAIVIQ
ncbi:MAG: hypothetical protein JO323_25725 [Acidobacteriia bacterium]|nr:hypothetical protein [Terriglobia bacterium]